MKNVKRIFTLIAVALSLSVSSFAQNGFAVYAGGNFPVGAFAKGGSLNDIAINNVESTLGGAATGFNAGVKYQFKLIDDLSLFLSADLFYNGMKEELKQSLENATDMIGVDADLPSYINVPLMIGANYTLLNIGSGSLWGEAGFGVNLRDISDSEAEVGVIESESDYHITTSYVWQAGAGVTLGDRVSIGVHYYAFGNSPISGVNNTELDYDNIIGNLQNEFKVGSLKPSMVVMRLGFHF